MKRFFASSGAVCALLGAMPLYAQTPVVSPTPVVSLTPVAPAVPTPASTNSAATTVTGVAVQPILLNINGRVVDSDPAPVLQNGSVLVPLRGVLENLGAKLNYTAASRSITVEQGGRRVLLVLGSHDAIVGTKAVKLSAAPQIIGRSTYVPLRSLAELFGFTVRWVAQARLVAIGNSGGVAPSGNHRAVLQKAGALGVEISLVEGEGVISEVDALRLLDAAKDVGASLIRIRFDWNVLEPTKGAAYQWAFYDKVVREARKRGLVVTGILGQSAKWASTFYKSTDPQLWRNGAPRPKELASWENYVRRVVGRYKNDVHAWQVWGKTSPDRFRSSQTAYRKLLLPAARAARSQDASAVIYAAESGGVDLDIIEADVRSEASPFIDGVTLYPASQNQPGNLAPSGSFLRPLANLRNNNVLSNNGRRDFWVGGLSRPVLREGEVTGDIATDDAELRARLLSTFTSEEQATYLVQSSTLSLAAGAPKVFWEQLRDEPQYESIAPINGEYNNGLLRRDFSPRPSYNAFRNLAAQTSGKSFRGSLALGPDIVALLFDSEKGATVVAWASSENARLIVNSTGTNPAVPNSLYISSRPDTEVVDLQGNVVGGAETQLPLTSQPLYITNVAYETRNSVTKPDARGLLLTTTDQPDSFDAGVSANFGAAGNESGISWRRFTTFRGAASTIANADGRSGLKTEVSRNALDPAAGKFFIFLDVNDNYLYFTRDVPVEVTVEVKRPRRQGATIATTTAGFNIEYATPDGTGRTPWQVVEEGDDWATYTYTINNASFANRGGYDLTLNTFGSKQDLIFGSVLVRRK